MASSTRAPSFQPRSLPPPPPRPPTPPPPPLAQPARTAAARPLRLAVCLVSVARCQRRAGARGAVLAVIAVPVMRAVGVGIGRASQQHSGQQRPRRPSRGDGAARRRRRHPVRWGPWLRTLQERGRGAPEGVPAQVPARWAWGWGGGGGRGLRVDSANAVSRGGACETTNRCFLNPRQQNKRASALAGRQALRAVAGAAHVGVRVLCAPRSVGERLLAKLVL